MSGVFLNNFYDNYMPYKTEKDFDQLIKELWLCYTGYEIEGIEYSAFPIDRDVLYRESMIINQEQSWLKDPKNEQIWHELCDTYVDDVVTRSNISNIICDKYPYEYFCEFMDVYSETRKDVSEDTIRSRALDNISAAVRIILSYVTRDKEELTDEVKMHYQDKTDAESYFAKLNVLRHVTKMQKEGKVIPQDQCNIIFSFYHIPMTAIGELAEWCNIIKVVPGWFYREDDNTLVSTMHFNGDLREKFKGTGKCDIIDEYTNNLSKTFDKLRDIDIGAMGASQLLPTASDCRLVVSMTLNQLHRFFRSNLTISAKDEIRKLAFHMWQDLAAKMPFMWTDDALGIMINLLSIWNLREN